MQLPCHSQEVSPGSMLQSQLLAVMIICTLSEVLRKKQQQSEAKEAVFPKGSMGQVKVVEGEGLRNAHSASFERPMVTESLGEGTQHCPSRLMESGGLRASSWATSRPGLKHPLWTSEAKDSDRAQRKRGMGRVKEKSPESSRGLSVRLDILIWLKLLWCVHILADPRRAVKSWFCCLLFVFPRSAYNNLSLLWGSPRL